MRHPLGTFELVVFTQSSVGGALSGRKHGHFMGTSPTALWRIALRRNTNLQSLLNYKSCCF